MTFDQLRKLHTARAPELRVSIRHAALGDNSTVVQLISRCRGLRTDGRSTSNVIPDLRLQLECRRLRVAAGTGAFADVAGWVAQTVMIKLA